MLSSKLSLWFEKKNYSQLPIRKFTTEIIDPSDNYLSSTNDFVLRESVTRAIGPQLEFPIYERSLSPYTRKKANNARTRKISVEIDDSGQEIRRSRLSRREMRRQDAEKSGGGGLVNAGGRDDCQFLGCSVAERNSRYKSLSPADTVERKKERKRERR